MFNMMSYHKNYIYFYGYFKVTLSLTTSFITLQQDGRMNTVGEVTTHSFLILHAYHCKFFCLFGKIENQVSSDVSIPRLSLCLQTNQTQHVRKSRSVSKFNLF